MDIESYIYGYKNATSMDIKTLYLWIEKATSIDRNTVNSR